MDVALKGINSACKTGVCNIDRGHSSGNELPVQTLHEGCHLNKAVWIPLGKHSKQALPCHYPDTGKLLLLVKQLVKQSVEVICGFR